jgi:hypothetical protein
MTFHDVSITIYSPRMKSVRSAPIISARQKKSKVDSGSGNLPSLRRPERTNQPPEPVRRVGKSLGIFKMRGHA